MSRFFAAFALLLLSLGTASAQMLPGNAAPPTHPGTRLNFPPSVAGAQLERSYTQPLGRDVQYAYTYLADKVEVTFFLFDGGRRVPAGTDSPVVTGQFASDLDAAASGIFDIVKAYR